MSIQSEITRIKEVRQEKRSDYKKLFNSVKQLVIFAKLPYFRPCIVLITDGNPDPYIEHKVNHVASKIRHGINIKQFIFNAIGIGKKVDKNFLRYISLDNYKRISRKKLQFNVSYIKL